MNIKFAYRGVKMFIALFIINFVISFQGWAQDEFLDVDNAFELNIEQQGDLYLRWQIADGYYLYQSRIKLLLNGEHLLSPALPQGVVHEDEFFGQQFVYKNELLLTVPKSLFSFGGEFSVRYQGCAEAGLCYPPITKKFTLSAPETSDTESVARKGDDNGAAGYFSASSLFNAELGVSGLGVTLLMFFILGLGLSFTPCVFPMYPILTSIIVGSNSKISTSQGLKLAFVYVQGMALTYTLMGIIVAYAGLQFQATFQHPVVLISLSVMFVALSLSMFGVYNLSLPSSWQVKLNELSNKQTGGSYVGVASMGVISGLVASPCTTAPLTAALVYIAQSGDVLLGALALYSLSLGMGFPLIVLGGSGGKLLPKAGQWMNVVKTLFGFLLLLVPVSLLQRLLPESVTVFLWLLVAASFGGYLLNLNASQKSGFWYGVRGVAAFSVLFFAATLANKTYFTSSEEVSERPVRFERVNNVAQLQAAIAGSNDKPVLLDLYADWCVACKEFERYTFTDEDVKNELNRWTLLQVDLTDSNNDDNQELMAYYQVLGLPAILLFEPSGEELTNARISGFMGADAFLSHLKQQARVN